MAENVEFRVMPSGDGRWYWEVITPGPTVIARGVADAEPVACREASEAARKAKLRIKSLPYSADSQGRSGSAAAAPQRFTPKIVSSIRSTG